MERCRLPCAQHCRRVLNAAFMTGWTIIVAVMQKYGATLSMLFLSIGAATLLVALAIWENDAESRLKLLPHLQDAINHLAGDAKIIRRIDQFFQFLAVGVFADLFVFSEQVDQRSPSFHHLTADIVD